MVVQDRPTDVPARCSDNTAACWRGAGKCTNRLISFSLATLFDIESHVEISQCSPARMGE